MKLRPPSLQVLNRMFLVMWCSLVPTVLGLVAVIALNVEFHALRREARDRTRTRRRRG